MFIAFTNKDTVDLQKNPCAWPDANFTLSNSKTTSNSCCVNLGLTGPDGVQVTIISYNIYQTLKLLVTHVVLTLASLDQMVYKSQSSVTIFIKL